jgi:hypothetical protein
MDADQKVWENWAELLTRKGFGNTVLELLDFIEPIGIFGAQLLYVFQPVINLIYPKNNSTSLAHLLEDSQRLQLFKEILRHEDRR